MNLTTGSFITFISNISLLNNCQWPVKNHQEKSYGIILYKDYKELMLVLNVHTLEIDIVPNYCTTHLQIEYDLHTKMDNISILYEYLNHVNLPKSLINLEVNDIFGISDSQKLEIMEILKNTLEPAKYMHYVIFENKTLQQ